MDTGARVKKMTLRASWMLSRIALGSTTTSPTLGFNEDFKDASCAVRKGRKGKGKGRGGRCCFKKKKKGMGRVAQEQNMDN